MTKKKSRFQKARMIAELNLIGVLSRDPEDRIRSAIVPGTDGKRYHVILRRNNGAMTTECRLEVNGGNEPCKGNSRTVCYHSIAALTLCAIEAKKEVAFCNDKASADLRARISGEINTVRSFQSIDAKTIWMVVQ